VNSETIVELRDLLFAGEDIVRTDWGVSHDSETSAITLSRGTAAASALDRIAQVGVAVVERADIAGLDLVIDTLLRLYVDAEVTGAETGQRTVDASTLARRRRDVVVRVYVLGALAVYQKAFQLVRPLVLQRADSRIPQRFWLREAVTSLARSAQFENKTLIPIVADFAAGHSVFFQRFRKMQDSLVDALCQFDFLQCLIVTTETNNIFECYPNFGAYFNERTEPIVVSIVEDGPARQVVAGVEDARLGQVIRELDRLAGEQFFSFAGWDSNAWRSAAIRRFLSNAS